MNDKELIKSLQKENEKLKTDFGILKEKATKINDDLQKENTGLMADVQLLNDEIKEIKAAGKSSKKEAPAKILTPKERGYTLISDLAKHKEQAIKNAPKRNKN